MTQVIPAAGPPFPARSSPAAPPDSAAAASASAGQVVTGLYQQHRLRLIGMALVLTGDRATAEDVVQEAFAGLYRAMPRLADRNKALSYVRASVINGCRVVHRSRMRSQRLHRLLGHQEEQLAPSAESDVVASEESRVALQAVARLRGRAREVLAMRYLLDMSDGEIAAALGVLAALARTLGERS